MPSPPIKRKLCEGPCGKSRNVRFFPPDARRTDGSSTTCETCRRRKRSAGTRGQRLVETYGISSDDYAALLEAQGGVCAICKGKRSYNLDVDHDHALERAGVAPRKTVRGLLCKTCNRRLLKSVHDDTALLHSAISYLTFPPAQGHLAA